MIKKDYKILLLVISLSFITALLFELIVYNYKTIKYNEIENAEIVEVSNLKKENDYYVTTEDKAYVVIKFKSDYVNKINFTYKTNSEYNWNMTLKNKNGLEKEFYETSSSIINKASRNVQEYVNDGKIKINFEGKNIKIKNFKINNKIYINWIRVLFITLTILLIFVLIKYRKYFLENIHKAFLLIGLFSGIMFLLVMPKVVYTSWDDQIHIKNIVGFTESYETEVSSAYQKILDNSSTDFNLFKTQEEEFELYKKLSENNENNIIQINNYASKYNKLVYLPYKLGMLIGDRLNIGFTGSIILSKFLNFLVYILLIYFAIKISPILKRTIFAIGLLISNIFLATQFSYDSAITASLILAMALFFRILYDKKLNKKYLILFILSVTWASLPKAIYAPFMLLGLFIPNDKFSNKKQAILIKSLMVFIFMLIVYTFVEPTITGKLVGDERGGNTDAMGQIKFIIQNPLLYAKILVKYFLEKGINLFVGIYNLSSICYLSYKINKISELLYVVSLVYLCYITFKESINEKIINNKMKIIIGIMIAGITLLIVTALYVSFNEVGVTKISGVQSRYFNPLMLPLLMIFTSIVPKTKEDVKYKNNILVLLIPVILTCSVCVMFIFR